jgi:hypothetical protein
MYFYKPSQICGTKTNNALLRMEGVVLYKSRWISSPRANASLLFKLRRTAADCLGRRPPEFNILVMTKYHHGLEMNDGPSIPWPGTCGLQLCLSKNITDFP